MGANTIRTYAALNDTTASNVAQVRAMLDKAQENGLYVIMGYYPSHSSTVDAGFLASHQAAFVAGVNAYKDHPAVLLWAIGNEQNLDNGQDPDWYPYVNTIAGAAKAADPDHPVMTVEGECPQCGPAIDWNIGSVGRSANDASMTNLDIWGFTAYRGKSFNGGFATLAAATSKPLLLAEFGKDAFKDSTQIEDQAMQNRYLTDQWTEISQNLSSTNASSPLVGAAWFEWSDEWWKADHSNPANTCNQHNSPIQFTRSGDTDDPGYNEEWFGLTAVRPIDAVTNPSGTARTLRTAYSTLQTLWSGSASSLSATGKAFNGTVRNYPNPFRVGAESTKFVALTGRATKVDIRIFDAGGQFVGSLTQETSGPERVELNWDGRMGNGTYVSPGLYVARIEGKGGGATETQYRRIVAVK